MKTVGFIGLGTMGKPMALNLLKNGYSLVVYNRTEEKCTELAVKGAEIVGSPAEVARKSQVLITMVSDDAAIIELVYGPNGILEGTHPELTVIDCSTIHPDLSRKIGRDLTDHFVDFLDAPVTGSKPAAESGTLLFMVGGYKEVLDEHRDILLSMGSKVVYMGGPGAGTTSKLAHNSVVALNVAALAEGFAIASKAGIDPNRFMEVVQNGGAASRMADLKCRKIIDHDFDVQFSLGLMLKDLQLAVEMTNKNRMPAPLLENVKNLYQMADSKGLADEDLSSIVKCYEDWIQEKIEAKPDPDMVKPVDPQDRRRNTRVPMGISLQIAVHQWQNEGNFTGQTIEGMLVDLSQNGMKVETTYPLAPDMFIVLHFPQEADLPPITARIIRVEAKNGTFSYGCLLSGLPPYVRINLEEYIQKKIDQSASE